MHTHTHTHTHSSVPSGRVGPARESVFRSNDHFREALAAREAQDVAELEAKMGRKWAACVCVCVCVCV